MTDIQSPFKAGVFWRLPAGPKPRSNIKAVVRMLGVHLPQCASLSAL